MCQMTAFMEQVKLTVRCTPAERERIKAKAKDQHMSASAYLLREGLKDKRRRNTEDSSTLAELYDQIAELNETLKKQVSAPLLEQCLDMCERVGREIVLYRLSKQLTNED